MIDDAARNEEAESLCKWAAGRAGAIVILPGLGTMSLIANDIYLVMKLGKVYRQLSVKSGSQPAGQLRNGVPGRTTQYPDSVCTAVDSGSHCHYLRFGPGSYGMVKGWQTGRYERLQKVYDDAVSDAKNNMDKFKIIRIRINPG